MAKYINSKKYEGIEILNAQNKGEQPPKIVKDKKLSEKTSNMII